jgi:uncharacterized protein involved in outer membrane biogenesis
MKKILLYGGIALLVLVIGGFITAQIFLGSIIKAGVNKFAPGITQTKVELAGASVSPFTGSGSLSGLVVGNPKGWSENNVCALGKIHVDVAPMSLLGDHIVIDLIEIDAPEFNYETKLVASNVGDLLKNIEQATGGGKGKPATAESGKPVKFEVKKFKLSNGKVRVGVGAAGMTLPMPPIELTDLGTKEGGITPDQLAVAVMRSVTTSIVSATTKAAGEIGKTSGAAAAEGVKQVGDAIKGLFGGKKE